MGQPKDIDRNCIAIVDTSVLLSIASGATDLESLIESLGSCTLAIPKPVIEELNKLRTKPGKRGRLAEWVLQNLVPRFRVIDVDADGRSVDEKLLEICRNLNVLLVTADRELWRKARSSGVRTVVFREAKRRYEVI